MTNITCTCKTCKTNSKGAGLSALVPENLLADLGNTAKTRHGLVFSANDPTFVGRVTRERLGIKAA